MNRLLISAAMLRERFPSGAQHLTWAAAGGRSPEAVGSMEESGVLVLTGDSFGADPQVVRFRACSCR